MKLLTASAIIIPSISLLGRYRKITLKPDEIIRGFPLLTGDHNIYPNSFNIKQVKNATKIKSIKQLLEICYDKNLVPYLVPVSNDTREVIHIAYAIWTKEYTEDEILEKIQNGYMLYVYEPEPRIEYLILDKYIKDSYEIMNSYISEDWQEDIDIGFINNDITVFNVHSFLSNNLIFPYTSIVFAFRKKDLLYLYSPLLHSNIDSINGSIDDTDISYRWSTNFCTGDYLSTSLDVFRTSNISSAYEPNYIPYTPGFSFVKWCL